MKRTTPRLIVTAFALVAGAYVASAAKPAPDSLFPLPENVRHIIDQRCVMCHGEVYDGKAEVREDLNMSTDQLLRDTLSDAGRLKEVLVKNQMPQKAKLSFRLRKDPKMKERLETIKAEYEKNGEKEVLLAWLKDVVATETPEKKKNE